MAPVAPPLKSLRASWIRHHPPSENTKACLLYLDEPPKPPPKPPSETPSGTPSGTPSNIPPNQIDCKDNIVICSGAIEHEGKFYIITVYPKSRSTACNCVPNNGKHAGCWPFRNQLPPPHLTGTPHWEDLGSAYFEVGYSPGAPGYLGLIPVTAKMCHRMGLKILQYPECIWGKENQGEDPRPIPNNCKIIVKSWDDNGREMVYNKTYPTKLRLCQDPYRDPAQDPDQSHITRLDLWPSRFGRGVRSIRLDVRGGGGTEVEESMLPKKCRKPGGENACGSWVMAEVPNFGESILGIVFTDSIGREINHGRITSGNPSSNGSTRPVEATNKLDQFAFISVLASDEYDDSPAFYTIDSIMRRIPAETQKGQQQSSSEASAPEPTPLTHRARSDLVAPDAKKKRII